MKPFTFLRFLLAFALAFLAGAPASLGPPVPAFGPAPAMAEGVRFAFNWRGTYSASTQYITNDLVGYSGSVYRARVASYGQTPASGSSYWEVFVSKGSDGSPTGVATIAALQAVTGQADGLRYLVQDKGIYRFSAASAATANGANVVAPNTGTGRWLLEVPGINWARSVSVAEYGAVGDGTTNDTSAFQAALAVGGVVYVPPGNYKVTSTLDLNKAKLVGAGWGTSGPALKSKLTFSALGTAPAFRTTQASTEQATAGLEGLYITCNSWDPTTGCTGYGLDAEARVTVRGCYFGNWRKSAVFLHHSLLSYGPYQSLFEGCAFALSGEHGVVVGTGANTVTFINCDFKWSGAPSFGVAPSVAGNYDGLYVDSANEGNPSSTYPTYNPEALTVIGGDASYNSRYGWNFQIATSSYMAPGYAEANLAPSSYQAHIGNGVHDCTIAFQRVSGGRAGINLDNSYVLYNKTNTISIGGTYLGGGNSIDGYWLNNVRSFFSASSDLTSYVTGAPSGSVGSETGRYTIDGTGTNGIIEIRDLVAVSATKAVTTTPYTITDNEEYVTVNVAGAAALTLPAHRAGRKCLVQDISGSAASNNITISPASGTINGAGTFVIARNRGAALLTSNGTNWFANDLAASVVDSGTAQTIDGAKRFSYDGTTTNAGLYLDSGLGTIGLYVGDGATGALGPDAPSTAIRLNGSGVAFGDIGYFPNGGSGGLLGHFRFMTSGGTLGATPTGKVGMADLYVGTNIGLGQTNPSARLHLPAGTATANTAPLKFASGTNTTTAEAGALEYDGTYFYATPSGTQRDRIFTGLTSSATLDFGSIAAGDTAEMTITVTGAATGDVVLLGPPSGLEADLVASGRVSAANTVTVRLGNVTAGAIDPASATWRATVIR